MKIVHASDLHLGSPLFGLPRYPSAPVEAFRGAALRSLAALVTLSVAEGASLLLLAGDVFDAACRDHAVGLRFVREMLRLRDAGIRVLSIRGNHDAASFVAPSLLLPENVRELGLAGPETALLGDLGVAVHGQSYVDRAEIRNLAAGYPPRVPGLVNVGLLHTSAEGRVGHDRYAPCTRSTLRAAGYDYWALGHVHVREVLAEDPWIVFPGNLQGRSTRESGGKGATVITIEGGRVAGVEHRAVAAVRFGVVRVDASRARSLEDVAALARAALVAAASRAPGAAFALRLVISGRPGMDRLFECSPSRRMAALRGAVSNVGGAPAWLESAWADFGEDFGGQWSLEVAEARQREAV